MKIISCELLSRSHLVIESVQVIFQQPLDEGDGRFALLQLKILEC